MHRSSTQAAALALAMALGAATGCSGSGGGGAGGDDGAAEGLVMVEDTSALTSGLVLELNSSVLRINGLEASAAVDSIEEARADVDAALAGLGPDASATLGGDLADELVVVREAVDQRIATGTGSLADAPATKDTTADYHGLLDRIDRDLTGAVRAGVADGPERRALEAVLATERLTRRGDELVRQLMESVTAGSAPEQVEQATAVRAELVAEAAEVRALDDPPYAAVVAAEFPTAAHERFVEIVDAGLATGDVDVTTVLDVSTGALDGYFELWRALLETVRARVG